MGLKNLGKLVLASILIFGGGSFEPVAEANSCHVLFHDAATQLPAFAVPTFIPGNGKSGPILNALVRYGKSVPKNTILKLNGKNVKIVDWGLKEDGLGYVRVETIDTGNVTDLAFTDFPSRAFALKTIALDEVMKYQNELVIDRLVRDYQGLTREKAQSAFDEMKKWLFVKFRGFMDGRDSSVAPFMYNEMDLIDFSWHTFLLFTNHYTEFGKQYFATYLHHKTQSYMDAQGAINAMPNQRGGPRAADVNRAQIVGYMRETLGEDTYRRWFETGEFDPYTNHAILFDPVTPAIKP